jgi:predicted extracellular nuclease
VQGAAHRSPLTGTPITGVPGIVIARRSNGFYIQDPQPDSSDSTSEGVFIFTSSVPTVAVGDEVRVDGQVQEFRPGCTPSCAPSSSDFDNLSITQIATGGAASAVRVVSSGNPTPTPVVLGVGGRRPPTQVIADDAPGDVENGGPFDPGSDGIDYYESLEGMLVQVNEAVATGPRRSTGEIPVVGDGGDGADQRTTRGGVVVRAGDFNPERIFLDDLFTTTPDVDVADRFPGAIAGVMDYSFGNYKLQALALPPLLPAALPRETAVPAAPDELAVATFNVENLDAADPPARFAGLASLIVNGLQSPDILALEEVQDDNGPTNDALVDATQTYARLIQAIKDTGGPAYEVRQVNPRDDQDGGQPGGNIRVALLFRFDRGLCFVDRPGAGPDSATIPVLGPEGLQLTYSPGRIEPTNAAWSNSRKPLAGEFRYNGQTLFVIANHFNSKGGDDPLYGRFQPPVLNTEAQRREQAQVERDFITALLALDPQARVVALGDLNDFEFSPPLGILKGTDMTALVETLPPGERYTYVFDGNSQALDHTLVSPALLAQVVAYDILHVNAEYVQRESDHDPQVTRFSLSGTSTSPGGASCGPAGTPSPTPTGAPGTATPTATAHCRATPGRA